MKFTTRNTFVPALQPLHAWFHLFIGFTVGVIKYVPANQFLSCFIAKSLSVTRKRFEISARFGEKSILYVTGIGADARM
jgi:hypothetical protein